MERLLHDLLDGRVEYRLAQLEVPAAPPDFVEGSGVCALGRQLAADIFCRQLGPVALALGDEPYPVLTQHETNVLGAEADVLGHLAQEQEAAECETGFRIVDVRLTTLLPKVRTANDKVAAACHDEN
ncbi:hypothetical protein PG990_007158 [Apiospora arundinis]